MSEWHEGDTATLKLSVDPADGTTQASVRVISPSGVETDPTALPNAGRNEWTSQLVVDEPGLWDVVWTVTGTGAGIEPFETLRVAPTTTTSDARVYATTADLAVYLDAAPPVGARRLLRKASRTIDYLLIGARYATDDAGLPTDPDVKAALRDATCAQADHLDADEQAGRYESVQIGSVRLQRAAKGLVGPGGESVAQDAIDALAVAGLIPIHPYAYG